MTRWLNSRDDHGASTRAAKSRMESPTASAHAAAVFSEHHVGESRSPAGPELGRPLDLDHHKVHEIRPVGNPSIERRAIGGLHQLIAVSTVGGHPTRDVDRAGALWHQPSFGFKASSDRAGLPAAECLDHHVAHARSTLCIGMRFVVQPREVHASVR